jgi:FkbH-like protein
VEKTVSMTSATQITSVPLTLPADPELLPLLDSAPVLVALANQSAKASFAPKKIRVVIAATFIAAPLASALQLYARAFGLAAEVEFFDFNQIPQALLDPDSPMRKNRTGLNVALIRPEDWPGHGPDELRVQAGHFLSAIKNFAVSSGCALLVSDLPPSLSPGQPGSPVEAAELTTWWGQQIASLRGVELLKFIAIIEEIGRSAARAMPGEGETPLPFSPAVYQRLGIGIARTLRKLTRTHKKVLALDADNTLWGGVVGEDGLTGLQLGDDAAGRGFRTLQAEILALKQRGVLLVLISKNAEADVWNVIDHHPRMLLRRNDFAAARINWQPKSENLRALAAELNLGLDAFVLLDDNPAERLEVAAHCPGVTVVPLPAHPERYAEILSRLWCFDGAGETREDQIRNAFAQQENQRQQLQQSAGELESYLCALELKVTLREARDEDLPRISQLLLKTNQFNLSLKRRTLPETRALLPEYDIWVLSVSDRFGDYGMVGVCITCPENGSWLLDTFLMSCRALGRGAETAFLHGIAQKARLAGATSLRGEFVLGPRNQPIAQFLVKYGFSAGQDGWQTLAVAQAPAAPGHLSLEIC